MLHVAACVKRRLEVDSPNGRMLNGEVDNLADFVLVDTAFDRGNQRHAQPDGSKPIQGAELFLKNAGLAANDSVGLSIEPVELKVEGRPRLIQLLQKTIIAGNTLAVGVDHHKWNAAILCRLHEVDDLGMDGGLTARKLNHFRDCLPFAQNHRALLPLLPGSG